MMKRWSWRTAVAVVGLSAAAASSVSAQVPHVEVGGDVGGFLAPGYATLRPGTRVSVAMSQRFAVESTFDLLEADGNEYGSSQNWIYAVQLKQTFRTGRPPGESVFATYGGGGLIFHSHTNALHYSYQGKSYDYPARSSTAMSWPLFGAAGVGFQQTLARYLAIRAEADAGIAEYGIFGRFSAGASIPLGRGYPR